LIILSIEGEVPFGGFIYECASARESRFPQGALLVLSIGRPPKPFSKS